jgi:transposase InsO family protein
MGDTDSIMFTKDVTIPAADYNDFLQYKAAHQKSSSAAAAQSGNPVAFVSTPSLGPWVLDSGASDHMTGNKSLLSHLSYSDSLPSVTVADGSKAKVQGLGRAHPLPNLSLESVLYIPGCPFNLISVHKLIRTLDCSVLFNANSVHIQDRRTGRTIGAGSEAGGLYHLSPPVACASIASQELTHQRLGHPSQNKMRLLVPSLSKLSSFECQSCQLGKHTRSTYCQRVNKSVASPFALVHSDIWGPSRVKSTLGYYYFVTFIDDYSRCTWLFLMKNRSDVFRIFQEFYAEIKNQFNTTIKILRTDNAREYMSSQFQSFLTLQGIIHQSSCAHTPQQNGVAERKNRHLVETARTLLLHHNVPSRFWGDALLTACHLINRMPSSVLQDQIPYSILNPEHDLYPIPLRVFGCTCFVHDLNPGKDKLSAKSLKCIFLGYSRIQKGYRCFCPQLQRYIVSSDVTFFEGSPFFSASSSSQEICNLDDQDIPSVIPTPIKPPLQVYQRRTTRPSAVRDDIDPPAPSPTPIVPPATSPELDLPIALRKGIRSHNPNPKYVCALNYDRLSTSYVSFVSALDSVSIPKSTGEAMTDPNWRQAMVEEMTALHSNNTWDIVPLPPDKTTVGCRWVYTVKIGPDGQIDRFKARLVAKGYTQIFGLDYGDTFSPVAKISSVRLFLALAAINHWSLHQLDIKNAFLHGELEEEVYMDQPPGFTIPGNSRFVCRLNRSLYGLKQSPRAWFGRFSSALIQFGMTRCEADHSVFFLHSSNGQHIFLVVYVDDIVITGDDTDGIQRLKTHLFKNFQTKDLGPLRYFLGIEVAQSSSGIAINQRKYALDILTETGMLDCRPIDTPMDPNVKLLPGQGELLKDPRRYRRLVGRLNYLTVTRPDITFAVSIVSQFLNAPCDTHWNAVIRILRYIKNAPGKGLLYEDKGDAKITCYSDADWAGSPSDRRSTSGYCVLIGGNMISWRSKKQNTVALSSAEAEYRAMAAASKELAWLKNLLSELRFGDLQNTKLICDNQAALHIASNPVFHERTKHIEIDCHYVRDKVLSGEITTEFVKSEDQLADMFTKSLKGSRVNYICNKLGSYNIYDPA